MLRTLQVLRTLQKYSYLTQPYIERVCYCSYMAFYSIDQDHFTKRGFLFQDISFWCSGTMEKCYGHYMIFQVANLLYIINIGGSYIVCNPINPYIFFFRKAMAIRRNIENYLKFDFLCVIQEWRRGFQKMYFLRTKVIFRFQAKIFHKACLMYP